MEKIINQILDLPQMLNQKLPKNCFNEMMDNSEGSVSDWTGKIFKVGALVVLVGMLLSVITGGMDAVNGADGAGKVAAGLCTLILIYAAFPIAQVVRSAGDSLAASKSSMVEFFFKDFIVANIKALGHITALTALFGAICTTVAWVLGSDGMSISAGLYDSFAYSYALPVDAMAAFMGMLGLEFVGGFIADFFSWDITVDGAAGFDLEGIVIIGKEYIQVVIILANLYVALAFYHFFYGVLNTFFNWIKSPYLPFKSS
jgi:hypothetical protein